MKKTFLQAGKYMLLLMSCLLLSCSKEDDFAVSDERVGFDSPVTEKFDGGSVTYQYNEGVRVLDKSTHSFLVKTEADTILYFSKSLPDELKPVVGGVISCGIVDEITPFGLGNRIISIDEEDGMYKCTTTSATLDEIFKELTISGDIRLITDTISAPVYGVDGNIFDVFVSSQNKTRGSIGSPAILTINIEADSHVGPFLAGAFTLGAVATVDIDIKQHKSECSLALYAGFEGKIGVHAKWYDYKKLLPPRGKWNIVTGVVALGPVVLRPYIDAELGLEGEIEGELSAGISKQFGGKFGIRNGHGFYENLTDDASDIIRNVSLDAKGEINLVTKLDFGIGLYTKNIAIGIEPNIKTGISTDFKLNNTNLFIDNPTLDFNIKADADAFFFAQLFGLEISHEQESLTSVELFSHSWPLLPSLEEKSLKVERCSDCDSLIFDAEYELTRGLLNIEGCASESFIKPAFRVYSGDREVCKVIDEGQLIFENDRQKFSFELKNLNEGVLYEGKPSLVIGDRMYDENGLEFSTFYVDLGLPSGTKWCCMNLGASSQTDFGEYYPMSEDIDIATEVLGNGYSTPTRAQFEELINYTNKRAAIVNGVNGMYFEAANGNSIFLPAAAHLWWNSSENEWGINNAGTGAYWTSTKSHYDNYFYFLEFDDEDAFFSDRRKDKNKLTIRAVYNEAD